MEGGELKGRNAAALPSALDSLEELGTRLANHPAVVFLDYDGTLTPIVSHPEDALLSDEMRRALVELAGVCAVAVVSGRDLGDVTPLVGLDELIYAGSHGFDIKGPDDLRMEYEGGIDHLPELERAERELQARIGTVPGARVERKRFAIANHYRNVAEPDVEVVEKAVREVAAMHPRLRMSGGKKVYELRPDIDWDKGRAVLWLLEALDLQRDEVLTFYIGDDVTDEDAFRVLDDWGVGVVVGDPPYETMAKYRLNDTAEVRQFLDRLTKLVRANTP
jgi:alpha,alpha-trehalase